MTHVKTYELYPYLREILTAYRTGVCACCERTVGTDDLRKGAFGDVVCKQCADADSAVYFDFFGRAES